MALAQPSGARGPAGQQAAPASSYRNVLHELLLALLGKTGDVFVDSSGRDRDSRGARGSGYAVAPPESCPIALAPDLSWIDRPDAEALNAIVTLGFHYRELDGMVRHELHPAQRGSSSYRRAIAAGLSEVLDLYSSAILRLEQYILGDDRPALSVLQRFSAEFMVLLGPLHHLIHRLSNDTTSSKKLLHELYTKCNCGVPALQSCLHRLLWHANQVMFRQLSAWMVHGLLQDPHGEFFVQKTHSLTTAPEPSAPSFTSPAGEAPLEPEDAKMILEWHGGFQIDHDLIPPGITLTVAYDILFIGKAVRVLQQPCGAFRSHDLLPVEDTLTATEALARLQEDAVFSRPAFERTIEQLRSKVAGRLWQLVVVDAELPLHLRALKDYFLLARGDFWQCFLTEASKLLAMPPRPNSCDADINIPFQQSALKTTSAYDKLFANLSIRLRPLNRGDNSQPSEATSTSLKLRDIKLPELHKNNWDNISIDYRVVWPLGMLLTPEILEAYDHLFRYLLKLKHVQLSLEEAWRTLKCVKGKQEGAALAVWRVRQLMSYVFNNLQLYYQLDVIEVQYSRLHESMSNAQDFNEAQRAHEDFITALIAQSFLDYNHIISIIEQLMEMCMKLCTWVEHGKLPPESEAETMATNFRKKTLVLMTTLQSKKVQSAGTTPHLTQLMLRLDYNSFLSKKRA